MFEIPETCEFTVEKADQAILKTKTNGDSIVFTGLRLSKEQVATAGYLFNFKDKILHIEIKLEEEQ